MRDRLKRWFGLRCILRCCPGTTTSLDAPNYIGHYVGWKCRDCGIVKTN